jgi:tripartite-type tricarboxylate transporter receptor subunit TctC
LVEKLYKALQQALKDPIIAERFTALSMQLVSEQQATPMALRDHLLAEVRKWAPVIKSAGEYAE